MGLRGYDLGVALIALLAIGCDDGSGGGSGTPDEGTAADTADADDNGTSTTGTPPPPTPMTTGMVDTGAEDTGPADESSDDDNGDGPPIVLDVGGVSDFGGIPCAAPPQVHCDHIDDDPWHAFGVNCGGGPALDGVINFEGPEQLYVHEGNLGTHSPAPYPPREGDKFVILSSGTAQDLTIPGFYASTSINSSGGPLPPPLLTNPVSPDASQDCIDNPALLGTGDCSNTVQVQWDQGNGSAFDYAEIRFTATVPPGTSGFTYDFAMFSTEYPAFYQTQYNDMYIAWLESEVWTGNVSFDDMGNPISLNAGFLDYKDAPNDFDCPAPCQAPELAGTAMEGHAGTRWLTTTAGVASGETIEVVLAVFDLSDSVLDTVILLDNFQWSCDGGPPVTIPG